MVVVSTAAFHARARGSVPGLSIVGSLRDRKVAYSASDRRGSNFESCVLRTVSSHSASSGGYLAQFSLYVHKGDLKPDSFLNWYISRAVERRYYKTTV